MPAYKRSDPGKLAKEQREIEKSVKSMNRPGLLERAEAAIGKKIEQNLMRGRARRAGFGPAPQRSGAEVIGTTSPESEA